MPIFFLSHKRKNSSKGRRRLPEKEIKEFTSLFNKTARKYATYKADEDPALKAFKERMKRWREY